MSNITITLNINAPELSSAVEALAGALTRIFAGIPAGIKGMPNPAPETAPQPEVPQPVRPVTAPILTGATVPTTAQTYSMEQLAVAATQLVDAGRRAELVQLLASFGAQALTALPKEHYGTFATQLRAMGAKI